MVIYPDREPDAAALLISLVDDSTGQANDAVRRWAGRVIDIRQALEAGKILVIVHDGAGSREARSPNQRQLAILDAVERPLPWGPDVSLRRAIPLGLCRTLGPRARRSPGLQGCWPCADLGKQA